MKLVKTRRREKLVLLILDTLEKMVSMQKDKGKKNVSVCIRVNMKHFKIIILIICTCIMPRKQRLDLGTKRKDTVECFVSEFRQLPPSPFLSRP